MPICTFFGHSDCYGLDTEAVHNGIINLIQQGVTEFLVGHQGRFDSMVRSCLKSLQAQYPHIQYQVVLAYLPKERREYEDGSDTLYPEGIETVHPKFAITWRNRYMIDSADICLCYVNRTWGGAYKYASMAKHRGLTVINLGSIEI